MEARLGLSNYALSALSFSAASEARSLGRSPEERDRYLAEAIFFSPKEAVPYYFRALWAHQDELLRSVLSKDMISVDRRELWVADLETALACDVNWEEARKLLERI